LDESPYSSPLDKLGSGAAIRDIPAERIHVFCASCAERLQACFEEGTLDSVLDLARNWLPG
jgi:hypothetical protein